MNNSPIGRRLGPHAALIFVQLFFGCAPVLGKAALTAFPTSAIVGFRVAGALAAFFILGRTTGSLALKKRSHYLYFALFSLLGVVLNQLFFFKGLSVTTAANTSLLAVTIPVFALLISSAMGSERLTWLKTVGTLIAASGVIYLIDPETASFSAATTQVDIMIILNSLFFGAYIAISKNMFAEYGPFKSMFWLFAFASVVILPLGIYSVAPTDLKNVPPASWMAVAAIVIFPTILAYYWNAWALARVSPSVVAVYIYFQALVGVVLAILFLGEGFPRRLIASTTLVFTGVFIVTRNREHDVISKM
jgi:drug/metabolite transporter (DMT)-like permease